MSLIHTGGCRPGHGEVIPSLRPQEEGGFMSSLDIIRAWKDEDYRSSLSEADRVKVPVHPAGAIEVAAVEMEQVSGGMVIIPVTRCTPGAYRCKPGR
jgi:mersacidin/lichenicidin family type 2 lantibiotic